MEGKLGRQRVLGTANRYFPATLEIQPWAEMLQVSFWSLTSNDHSTTDAKVISGRWHEDEEAGDLNSWWGLFKSWTKYV